ncbi:CGNR zinc finger domain-containing protein [Agromyces sp. SYSU K20354]|uniref:CGNR zinc finger domain-containing protein n=1 Tax=Agromyces cavernae TaxID=2898659 RepID=UPI001E568AB2|nr:CGNR zinc finger domain-containing protein [Agromyces cavernae]MCD2441611.1 CGNR zinc finger domain-containing protein [Agromyces cavernae]
MPVSTVSIPVGQWLVSPEGTRWWFDSGSLALDFATTAAVVAAGTDARADQLHTPDDLSAWLRERFPVPIGVARTRDLFDAISLRDAVGRMALRASRGEAPSPADIDVVNLYAATPDVPPSIVGGTRQVGRSVHTVPQSLSTIARDAVDLFDPANAGRIRACSGEDCGMVYLDTSRAATRRWCSMQRCGNRAKVRAHRARKRPAADVAA